MTNEHNTPPASPAPAVPTDSDPTSKEQYRRMFVAACEALGAISDALGCDPEDGGAEPILGAIEELQTSLALSNGILGCLSATPPVPAEVDVRTILLDIVPGDGNGHEVYAKTVDDVVNKLTEVGVRLEDTERERECLREVVASSLRLQEAPSQGFMADWEFDQHDDDSGMTWLNIYTPYGQVAAFCVRSKNCIGGSTVSARVLKEFVTAVKTAQLSHLTAQPQEPVTLTDDDIARCINVATCGRPFIGLMNPGGIPSVFSRSLADLLIDALREKGQQS